MKNNIISEIAIATTLIILLVLLVNPFSFWMPSAMHMAVIAVLLVVLAVFSVFIWQEKASDEREKLHRSLAGRLGFLAGAIVLTVGITYQSYVHQLDLWLVYALAAMVGAKIFGLIYGRIKY